MGEKTLGDHLNVRPVCAECAPKPDPQYFDKELEWFIGKHVKLAFPVPEKRGPSHEHMWVMVRGKWEEDDSEELWGSLANEAFFADIGLGDAVAFSRNEVEEVLDGA